jgi:hypothetical protein
MLIEMDPYLAKIGEQAISVLETEAETFLQALITDPAKELGGLLKDKIRSIRHSNLIRIVVSAKRKLQDAGISPREVPLKIIHPLLENASLEEDDDLQERWSNLLANAADPAHKQTIRPSFIAILKELTPKDALFLDTLFEAAIPLSAFVGYSFWELDGLYPHSDPAKSASLRIPSDELLVALDTLERNGLVAKHFSVFHPSDQSPAEDSVPVGFGYSVSRLGMEFASACRSPVSRDLK